MNSRNTCLTEPTGMRPNVPRSNYPFCTKERTVSYMQKYYFHYRDATGLLADEEGSDFDTFEDATAEAHASARDMAIESIKCGTTDDAGTIEMTAGGDILMSVPLFNARLLTR
jgi:hypothetical protein